MGHNSVVSGHPKSTGIPRVYGLLMGPLDLRRHILCQLHSHFLEALDLQFCQLLLFINVTQHDFV